MLGFGADPVCGVTDDICRQTPYVAFCRSIKTGKMVETYLYQARYNELSQIADKRRRHCEACRLSGGTTTCERAPQCETMLQPPRACPYVTPSAATMLIPQMITGAPGTAAAPGSQPGGPGGPFPPFQFPGMMPLPTTPAPAPVPGMQTMPGELPPEIAEALFPTDAAAPGEPRPGEAVPAAAGKNWLAIAAIGAAVLGVGYLMMKKEKRS